MINISIDRSRCIALILFLVTFPAIHGLSQDTIRIMPLGNSITEGYTDGTLTTERMRGYRYGLRYLMKNAGYKIDLVGSQSGGSDYFNDCQHAGIGGTRDQYIIPLLNNGYDERNGVQILVPPRPYLDEYNPDIILLHIGTNDITHEGNAAITNQKVTDILNLIDQYESQTSKEVIVFLALIINRLKPWLPGSAASQTTAFNNAIKSMAQARIASGDKIVIVDMENNAGFLYDATDMMADGIHPNEMGYSKMAALWFSSITANYNTAPVITTIPDQVFNEGGSSGIIMLDNFVADLEDQDQDIIWTNEQLGEANLNITINENRQAVATPKDMDWSGSQTVVFTATDNGKNGKSILFDRDTVLFTVISINDAPVITSTPVYEALVGNLYTYTLAATDVDNAMIILSAVSKPAWLSFSGTTGMLTGTPLTSDQGQNPVLLRVSDGLIPADQSFTIDVDNPDALFDPGAKGFYIYPVPAQNYLMIEFGDLTGETLLEVVTTSGTVIQKLSVQATKDNYRLDLDKIENGIYFLHLRNKTTNYISKFSLIN